MVVEAEPRVQCVPTRSMGRVGALGQVGKLAGIAAPSARNATARMCDGIVGGGAGSSSASVSPSVERLGRVGRSCQKRESLFVAHPDPRSTG
jgi:hypothetical protein